MFNVTPENAAGGPISSYLSSIHPDDLPRAQEAIENVVSGKTPKYEVEYRLLGADGLTRWVVAKGQPQRSGDGSIERFPGVIIDITTRKLAEKALLDESHRKDEFLAMLAHELRNPLAPIRNGVRVLEQSIPSELVAQVLPMMRRQTDHMVRLVDDLLDVSRVSQGKIELRRERVDLAATLRQVMESIRPLCDKLEHNLTLTVPARQITLDADRTRLAQVFTNLLNNSCKFTNRGGEIGMVAEIQGDTAVVHVKDNGIGVAADQLHRIFDLFAQVDTSLARIESGLGIGLTLVRRLVEMHGGTVCAHSAGLGKGMEILVRLPLLQEGLLASPVPQASAGVHVSARRILVVDDNRDSAESLAMLLKLEGHEVEVAFEGNSALEAIATTLPDVALLDIGLPGMDGYELARRIRDQHGNTIRLIALTGWGQADDRTRTKEAGFDVHLTKPVELSALSSRL